MCQAPILRASTLAGHNIYVKEDLGGLLRRIQRGCYVLDRSAGFLGNANALDFLWFQYFEGLTEELKNFSLKIRSHSF